MWIEFITNTECNWNCRYCNFDKVENTTFDYEKIDKHLYIFDMLDKLAPTIDLTYLVQGGEIGLVEDNALLEYFFAKFNKKVIVDTNGTFMEMDRSPLYPYIDSIFYHVVDHAANLIKVKEYSAPVPIIHGLTDDNAEEILKFIDYNDHIFFQYVDFEADPGKKGYCDITMEHFYDTLADNMRPNMEARLEHALRYKAGRRSFYHRQSTCRITDQVVTIDLAREVLCSCTTKGCTNTIPLTEENLKSVLTSFGNFDDEFEACRHCYRSCFSASLDELLGEKKNIRKLI